MSDWSSDVCSSEFDYLAGAEIAYDLAQSRAQFASMHHHVDHAVIQKIFGALESLGQFFPNGVLDNALPCKTDECIGFGNLNIAQHGVAGRYTASRGIGKEDRKSTRLNSSH